MPRKKLIYTDIFPYHITARSNNKEWFYLPKSVVWKLFAKELNSLTVDMGFKTHAFVLMDNHYHLLATTSYRYNLGHVMQRLQKNISLKINKKAKRINHVFGGPYYGSLITTPDYYKTVIRYVYRNPVEGSLCDKVEDYAFSSLNTRSIRTFSPPVDKYNRASIDCLINFKNRKEFLIWLNQKNKSKDFSALSVRKGLRKTQFKPVFKRTY